MGDPRAASRSVSKGLPARLVGVLKQRIARRGKGKSGGFRCIIHFQRDNMNADEKRVFKEAAKHVLALTDRQMAELVNNGDFVEVKRA